jgi:hypothetical protein
MTVRELAKGSGAAFLASVVALASLVVALVK